IPRVVDELDRTPRSVESAARGMMTTDTVPKMAARRIGVAGCPVQVTGAAKGAAMIAPNMATMLAVVMTDARLSPQAADSLLRNAVESSFNRISIDGHTSTSDTVLLLANGASEVDATSGNAAELLQAAVREVCAELAEAIVRDAEGATHFVTV